MLVNKRLSKEEKEFVIHDTTPKLIFADKDELNISLEIKEKKFLYSKLYIVCGRGKWKYKL